MGFTKKNKNQIKKTSYAQSAQIRQIRAKMFEIVQKEAAASELKEFVQKLLAESISKDIEKQAQAIFPLQNVFIRKVKVIKKPKIDRKFWKLERRNVCLFGVGGVVFSVKI